MGIKSDKIVNLKEDKKVTEIRNKVNELRTANTELRRQTKNKGLPTNVRDELFARIDENTEMIEELLLEMKKPTIVPITGTSSVSEHNYEADSKFRTNSVRF